MRGRLTMIHWGTVVFKIRSSMRGRGKARERETEKKKKKKKKRRKRQTRHSIY